MLDSSRCCADSREFPSAAKTTSRRISSPGESEQNSPRRVTSFESGGSVFLNAKKLLLSMDNFIPDRASRSSPSLRQGAGGRGEPVVESADQTLPRNREYLLRWSFRGNFVFNCHTSRSRSPRQWLPRNSPAN